MHNELQLLSEIDSKLFSARTDFTPTKERWYAWNYWAQSQKSRYAEWLGKHRKSVEIEKALGTAYPYKCDVRLDWEEGHRYYSAWIGGNKAIEDLEKHFDVQLRICERSRMEGRFTRQDIADALGRNVGAVNKLINTKKWKTPGGVLDAS